MGLAETHEKRERILCWHCHARFENEGSAPRTTCPHCASPVGLHRLNLPALPTDASDQSVSLPFRREGQFGEVRKNPTQLEAMPHGPEMIPVLDDRVDEEISSESAERCPFEPRHRIAAWRQERFQEAEPRPEGLAPGFEPPVINSKTLLLSLGAATVLFLAVALALAGH